MRRRRLPNGTLFALLTALAAAPSCGGGAGNQTANFVGPWTFSSGSITPSCALLPGLTPFSLAGLTVVFTEVDGATISLSLGTQCTVLFKVSGSNASVEPKQTCTLDIGGVVGTAAVSITTWTLTLSGNEINSMLSGSAENGLCTASGPGVLERGAGDGGAPHRDAGTRDGNNMMGSAGAGGGQPEGGATDSQQEAGTETGGMDTGASETASDGAASETAPADGGAEAATTTDAADAVNPTLD